MSKCNICIAILCCVPWLLVYTHCVYLQPGVHDDVYLLPNWFMFSLYILHTYVYPCIFIVCSIFKTTLHNLCIMYYVVTDFCFLICVLCPSPNNPPSSRVLSGNKLRLAGWAREDGKTTLHEIDQIAFFFPCPRVIVDATNKWMNAPEWMDECCLMYCEFL